MDHNIITTFHPRHFLELSVPYIYKYNLEECILCGKQVHFQADSYFCGTCEFHFHIECATTLMKSSLTINHPETHEHTLTFLRKKNSFNCDACGMVDERKMNMYACVPCNFFVHRNCIYLPKVIKITRHPQRLFHTLQFYDDGYMNCRVCNGKLVCGYGGYSCIDNTCVYKVHSYCATNSNVWDGKDLRGEAEEEINLIEDVELPLFEIDSQRIRHFSHHHDLMKLYADNEDESGRICQACILPIDFDSFFGCKECDFALHNNCASLPRKMEHALHRHSIILQVDMMTIEERFFTCSICDRESCGFMYRCCREECGFKMDARCGFIAEPFYHVAHQHPLSLFQNFHDNIYCSFCHLCTRTFAACSICSDMYMDFKCATLPILVKCKYDMHPLTLSFSLSSYDSTPWYELSLSSKLPLLPLCCDICEGKIDQTLLFYICYDCNTTIHVECLIGKYPYLKPGHKIKVNGVEIQITYNTLSRPICHTCRGFCQDKLVFINRREDICFCSIKCINSSAKAVGNLVLIE